MKNRHTSLLLLSAALLVLAGPAVAQNGFNVPFSQFGIGLNDQPFNLPSMYGMGGAAYSRAGSAYINPMNPASYGAIGMESFVLDFGMNLQASTLSQGSTRVGDMDGDIAHIMVAFPILKWWKTALGLLPYSQVDYQTIQEQPSALQGSTVSNTFEGTGGVSQLFWGNAFNIGQRLMVGFNINYLYGSLTRALAYEFDQADSLYLQDSRRQKDTKVSNLVFDLGLRYAQPLGERYTLNVGLTCRLPRTMSVEDRSLVYTYVKKGTVEYLCDTIFPQAGKEDTYQSTLQQPLTMGLGVALERNDRWEIDLDGYYSPYSGMKYIENTSYNILGNSSVRYAPNWRVSLGGEWKGDINAASYWGRIGIHAGVYYNHGRLTLEHEGELVSLDEKGVGLGFTFPMRKGRSILGLNFAYSRFGHDDILQRDLFSIGISLGANERWFVKKKYN